MRALLLIAAALTLSAQQTRHEITNPGPAGTDARANSDAVPDVIAIPAQLQKLVILRFKFDTDLLAGIEREVKEQHIKNAVILSAAGSVRGYQVHQVSNRTFPSKNMFVKDPTAPADLISMNGYVIDGKVHAHCTLARPDGAFGGHLEPDTKVFTFAIVTLAVLNDDAPLSRADDKSYR